MREMVPFFHAFSASTREAGRWQRKIPTKKRANYKLLRKFVMRRTEDNTFFKNPILLTKRKEKLMKRLYWKTMTMSLAIAVGSGLMACGGDDGNEGGSPGGASGSGVIKTDNSSIRLSQVGRYRFYYDEKGRIERVTEDNDDEYLFGYNPNTVSGVVLGEGSLNVSYNSSGYITKISGSYTYDEHDEAGTVSGTVNYSYDGSGHLVGVSGNGTENGTYGGEKRNYKTNYSSTLKWGNNLLNSSTSRYSEVVTKEKETKNYEEEISHSFNYNESRREDYLNAYLQWTPGIGEVMDECASEPLAYIGLFGKGPQYLPESCSYRGYDNDDDWESHSTLNYSYSFNADGTVSRAYDGHSYRQFSYSIINDDTRAAGQLQSSRKSKLNAMRKLFGIRHQDDVNEKH